MARQRISYLFPTNAIIIIPLFIIWCIVSEYQDSAQFIFADVETMAQ